MSEARQRLTLATALVVAGLLAICDVTQRGDVVDGEPLGFVVLGVAVVLAVCLGGMWSWRRSLIGLVPLVVAGTATGTSFNPLLAILAVGGWLCGVVISAQRRLAQELVMRTRELQEEQELFAVQSVRYERAQIAREMHDVVAHCVSLIVVQANAGAYLASTEPSAAVEVFGSIREIATQARVEVEHLNAVLDAPHDTGPSDAADLLETVVARATASGLSVDCHLSGELGALPPTIGETIRRLVQESITNVIKHAPGAPIRITLHGSEATIAIEVANPYGRAPGAGLRDTGGGRGLGGMRERVLGCGGTFDATASPDGTWRVTATLPRQMPADVPRVPA
jgi:signal transduction histidine kinase